MVIFGGILENEKLKYNSAGKVRSMAMAMPAILVTLALVSLCADLKSAKGL